MLLRVVNSHANSHDDSQTAPSDAAPLRWTKGGVSTHSLIRWLLEAFDVDRITGIQHPDISAVFPINDSRPTQWVEARCTVEMAGFSGTRVSWTVSDIACPDDECGGGDVGDECGGRAGARDSGGGHSSGVMRTHIVVDQFHLETTQPGRQRRRRRHYRT